MHLRLPRVPSSDSRADYKRGRSAAAPRPCPPPLSLPPLPSSPLPSPLPPLCLLPPPLLFSSLLLLLLSLLFLLSVLFFFLLFPSPPPYLHFSSMFHPYIQFCAFLLCFFLLWCCGSRLMNSGADPAMHLAYYLFLSGGSNSSSNYPK